MNTQKYRFIMLFIGIASLMFSCEPKFEDPVFEAPKYTGKPANKTIAQLKAIHTINGALDSIPKTYIVSGTVVSTDKGGNYYKTLTIQDETGGIEIKINQTGLYNEYHVGQKVILQCKGLVIGDYGGMAQVGWIFEGSVGQIAPIALGQYLFRDGMPGAEPAPQIINSASDLTTDKVCKLVRIENCYFNDSDVGLPFAEDFTVSTTPTTRTLNINGGTIAVRTSTYANFRRTPVPAGTGTIVGILTIYNGSYQLMIRTIDDILPFGSNEVIQEINIDENSLGTGGWSIIDNSGANTWRYVDFGDKFMYAEGNGDTNDDWLISPPITQTAMSNLQMYINHKFALSSGLQSDVGVYYSNTYTGGTINESEWTNLNVTGYPSAFGLSNPIDFSSLAGSNFRIAFRYKSTGTAASKWSVKGIQFSALVFPDKK